MARANFSQRRRLDGPWGLGRWRDYFPTRRRDRIALSITYAFAAAASVAVIWFVATR